MTVNRGLIRRWEVQPSEHLHLLLVRFRRQNGLIELDVVSKCLPVGLREPGPGRLCAAILSVKVINCLLWHTVEKQRAHRNTEDSKVARVVLLHSRLVSHLKHQPGVDFALSLAAE